MVTMQLDVLHRTRIIIVICLIRQVIHQRQLGCCSWESPMDVITVVILVIWICEGLWEGVDPPLFILLRILMYRNQRHWNIRRTLRGN